MRAEVKPPPEINHTCALHDGIHKLFQPMEFLNTHPPNPGNGKRRSEGSKRRRAKVVSLVGGVALPVQHDEWPAVVELGPPPSASGRVDAKHRCMQRKGAAVFAQACTETHEADMGPTPHRAKAIGSLHLVASNHLRHPLYAPKQAMQSTRCSDDDATRALSEAGQKPRPLQRVAEPLLVMNYDAVLWWRTRRPDGVGERPVLRPASPHFVGFEARTKLVVAQQCEGAIPRDANVVGAASLSPGVGGQRTGDVSLSAQCIPIRGPPSTNGGLQRCSLQGRRCRRTGITAAFQRCGEVAPCSGISRRKLHRSLECSAPIHVLTQTPAGDAHVLPDFCARGIQCERMLERFRRRRWTLRCKERSPQPQPGLGRSGILFHDPKRLNH